MHANSAADVPARFEALGVAAGLDRLAVHSQLAAALAVVVHLVRADDGVRRVAEIAVTERPAELVETRPAVILTEAGRIDVGPGAARLERLLTGRTR